METIVITGNGFDIDLGLKTRFGDFINSYEFKSIADIPFIKKMRRFQWNDIEGKLRNELIKYAQKPSDKYAENINAAWLMITRKWGIYLPASTEIKKIAINKESCAYQLLKADEKYNTKWFTFNYTNPWYLCQLEDNNKISFVHNPSVPLDWAKEERYCHYIPTNLIIGVDSAVPDCIKSNEKLSPIIKTHNPNFNKNIKCELHKALISARNVIIFGHSLGITDSDYFKPYFEAIINETIHKQQLYIVTYDQESLKDILKNIKRYGLKWTEITMHKVNIKIIYTQNKTQSEEYKEMIKELYPSK